MSLKKLLFLISLIISFTNYSQDKTEENTKTRTFFPQYYGEKKWKFYFHFDARRSVFQGNFIKINGYRIGANYKGVNRFGIGIHSIRNKDKIEISSIPVDKPDALHDTVKVGFAITTLFYERVFYKTKRWEISLPIFMGTGNVNSEYTTIFDNKKLLKKEEFSVIGLGINTHYYIFPWLSPKLSIGYRFAFTPNQKIADSFSKPFYGLGLSINPIGAYRHYKKWRTDKKENQSLND